MPVWLLPILIKLLESIGVALLDQSGLPQWAAVKGVQAGTHVIHAVEDAKTYDEYPTGVNGDTSAPPVSVSNINGGSGGT